MFAHKLKILILSSYHLPNISGITIETQRLAEELQDKFNITILTSQHQKNLRLKQNLNGVTIKRMPVHFFLGKAPVQLGYLKHLIKEIKEADLVNLHWPYAESFLVALICKLLKKPLVIIHHVDEPDFSTMPQPVGFCASQALHYSHCLSGLVAQQIVTRTKDYAQHSQLLQKFKDKLSYCYPLIYYQKPSNNDKTQMEERLGHYSYVLGFSGRISREKGIASLLQAIPRLKERLGNNFMIALAGPAKEVIGEDHLAEIKSLLSKYQKHIKFLGELNHGELFAFYQAIDCLVLPSLQESFGQVQVESMLAGTPVVVSDLPGARVPVNKTGMGLATPVNNSQQLAATVLKVLKNPDNFTVSQDQIKKAFSPKKVIRFYQKLFLKHIKTQSRSERD